jgi:hypothetical protein
VVSIYMAAQVQLGNGDATQVYIPAGSLETSDKGKVQATIEKSTEEPGALSLSRACLSEALSRGAFARSALASLPSGVTAAGNQYNLSVVAANEGATVEQKAAVTVQIEYDPDKVSSIDDLNVWHLIGSTWAKEATNRGVDTANNIISVEVTSLSPFISAVGEEATARETPTTTTTTTTAAGADGGGCFITTAASGLSGVAQQMLIVLALLAMGFFAVRLRAQRPKRN